MSEKGKNMFQENDLRKIIISSLIGSLILAFYFIYMSGALVNVKSIVTTFIFTFPFIFCLASSYITSKNVDIKNSKEYFRKAEFYAGMPGVFLILAAIFIFSGLGHELVNIGGAFFSGALIFIGVITIEIGRAISHMITKHFLKKKNIENKSDFHIMN